MVVWLTTRFLPMIHSHLDKWTAGCHQMPYFFSHHRFLSWLGTAPGPRLDDLCSTSFTCILNSPNVIDQSTTQERSHSLCRDSLLGDFENGVSCHMLFTAGGDGGCRCSTHVSNTLPRGGRCVTSDSHRRRETPGGSRGARPRSARRGIAQQGHGTDTVTLIKSPKRLKTKMLPVGCDFSTGSEDWTGVEK